MSTEPIIENIVKLTEQNLTHNAGLAEFIKKHAYAITNLMLDHTNVKCPPRGFRGLYNDVEYHLWMIYNYIPSKVILHASDPANEAIQER